MVEYRGAFKTAHARHSLSLALIDKGHIPSTLSPGCQLLLAINLYSFHVNIYSPRTFEILRPSLQNHKKRHF